MLKARVGISLIASSLLSILSFDPWVGAQQNPPPKVSIAYSSFNMPASLVWIAKDDHLFAKHGLDLELIYIPGGTTVMAALVSGNINFAQLTGSPGAYAFLGGADVVYLAASMESMSYQIVVRPEIRAPQDLKGKRFGISRFGSSPDVAARMAMRKLGLNPDTDVSIIQAGSSPERLAALLGKKIDATVLNAPFDRVAEKYNLRIVADTGKMGIPYFDTGIVTTRRFLKNNEENTLRFLRAYVEAIKVFKTSKSHAKEVAGRYSRLNDPEALEDAYSYFVDKIPRYPYPTAPGMRTVLEEIARNNPRARNIKPQDLIDSRFVKELQLSGFIDNLYKE